MDVVNENSRKLFRKYLTASLFSALVLTVYSAVDAIAIGQSEGPVGSAAMAVLTPLYGVLDIIPVLIAIGGSILLGNARGEGDTAKADSYFTGSAILMGIVSAIVWTVFFLFPHPIFIFFGADEELYPKVMEYAQWLIAFCPVFLGNIFISTFIRNDGAPNLVMAATVAGGVLNMFLDWFLVFPMKMGMQGAAIATVIGTLLQVLILCTHFFKKTCALRLVRPKRLLRSFREIVRMGFGAAVLDSGNTVLAVMMNNQIMHYGGTTELAVYGVIVTVGSLFQAVFNGVGQAVQPLVSVNFGANRMERVKSFWRMSLRMVLLLGALFMLIGELAPNAFIRIFIDATPQVLAAAPGIVRLYFPMFVPLGVTVAAIYYLQSTLHAKMALTAAVLRSVALSGILIYALPALLGPTGIWIALPVSEAAVAAFVFWYVARKVNEAVLTPDRA